MLEIFKHLLAAVPEEMGALLRKASLSPNIKERRDFSCALFDAQGRMIAQAAHIPVHLGAMPLSVAAAIQKFPHMQPGDAILLNHPYHGGSHLPDITLVSPIFLPFHASSEPRSPSPQACAERSPSNAHSNSQLEPLTPFAFAASRAHHADVGGMAPGSMPIARELIQEGLIIPPIKLVEAGKINQAVWDLLLANVRTPQERGGDLRAQLAANQRGVQRVQELLSRYGAETLRQYMQALLDYTERLTRNLLRGLPDGEFTFTDYLDDDGIRDQPIPIRVKITIAGDQATVDFTGSAPQQPGSVNAVYAITLSAVYYVFRSLLGLDVPNNAGALAPITVIAPEGTIVNARYPAPVAGGNVETSQRITDVLLGALAQAIPERIPAASQGTMNNLTIGGLDDRQAAPRAFTYYETIAGGMGAHARGPGLSARHSHMTNTLNTPVEALEFAYPLRVERYEIRRGSGGAGRYPGGDGVRRDIRTLVPAQANLITERRKHPPYGLAGGQPGQPGQNVLIRDGREHPLPGKGRLELQPGDVISIRTPGGGGYGAQGEE